MDYARAKDRFGLASSPSLAKTPAGEGIPEPTILELEYSHLSNVKIVKTWVIDWSNPIRGIAKGFLTRRVRMNHIF